MIDIENREDEVKSFIMAGMCPICKSKKVYVSIASHVSLAHGISAYELRKMAGLNRSTSICDPSYHDYLVEKGKNIPKEQLEKFIKSGQQPNIIRDRNKRTEGKNNMLKWLLSERHLKLAHENLSSPMSLLHLKEAALKRSPVVVQKQTLRVQNGRKHFLEKLENDGINVKEYLSEQSRKAGNSVSHDNHVKAAHLAIPVLKKLHKDPNWRAIWLANLIKSLQKKAKVPHSDWSLIYKRINNGEKYQIIANEYKVSKSYIKTIVRSMRHR